WTKTTLPHRQVRAIDQDDRLMLNAAGIVFTVSRDLYEKKRAMNPNTYLLPNGVQSELYEGKLPEPSDLAALQRPVLGYAGTLHPQRIAVDMLADAARAAREDYSIALVGPNLLTTRQQAELRRTGRVHFLGEKSRLDVPAYISNFDVCLIPHVVDAFTESLNPIKIYEYLAAGKPVVSTVTAGMEEFAEFLTVPPTAESFIREALRIDAVRLDAVRLDDGGSGDIRCAADRRREAVRDHTWAARASRAISILENATGRKPG
ncbi:MAG: glycosyltransferase, partial [bacterium]